MKWLQSLAFGLGVTCLSFSTARADTLYVTVTGSGSRDCSSWHNACTLPSALAIATKDAQVNEVWVAAGTYYGSIALVDGVSIIGGFSGMETSASQSDPIANQTTLNGNGIGPIVTGQDDSAATMLRGFRITNGYNEASIIEIANGGGGINLKNSDAMFAQCVIDQTASDWWGGAIEIDGGAPEFINCSFHDNGEVEFESGVALTLAGGVLLVNSGTPQFTNCLFSHNTAMEGGAVAIANGTPTFINCTFVDNDAVVGGAGGVADPLGLAAVKNCIFWGNTSVWGDPNLSNYSGRFSELSNTLIAGGYPGLDNIDANPLFLSNQYHLRVMSPGRNSGEKDWLPMDVADLDWDDDLTEPIPVDLDGRPRTEGLSVDMGVYETRMARRARDR